MRSVFLKGLLIFSLTLNMAVAGTILWHWRGPGASGGLNSDAQIPFSRSQAFKIKRKWMETSRGEMGKTRELVTNKYSEIIDLISSEQVDREKLNKALDEMVLLRGAMERRAVMRLKKVFQSIPEENRKAFAEFLKERVCLGRGFHHGRGRHGRRGCPMGGGGH